MRDYAPLRPRLAEESGFGIIEVLVSAVILVIASLGMFAAFDSANATSSRTKQRTLAAQLAQAEQERVRAKTPSQLALLTTTSETTSKTVNGRVFTAVSSASWVRDASGTASCAGMGSEAGFLRISSSVTWNNQGTVPDVVQDSIKAVPNGGYLTSRGSLAVRVFKRDGVTGQPNIAVTIVGPGPKTYNATTDSNGCVLLGFVPVGSYTVTLNQTNYVRDVLPNAQSFTETVQVQGEQTATASLNYDLAGTLAVKYFTRVPGATADVSTINAVTVKGDAFTIANGGLTLPPKQRYFPASAPATAAATLSSPTRVLYPFTGAYAVWSGRCASNDPLVAAVAASSGYGTAPTTPGTSGNGAGIVTAGGTVSNVQAFEPMLKLTVTKYGGQVASETPRVSVTPSIPGCTAAFGPLTTSSTGTLTDQAQPTMPYGTYTICAQDRPTNPTRTVVQTNVKNDTRGGKAITLALPSAATTKKTCP